MNLERVRNRIRHQFLRRIAANRVDLYRVVTRGTLNGGRGGDMERKPEDTPYLASVASSVQTVGKDRVEANGERGQNLTHTVLFGEDVGLKQGDLIDRIPAERTKLVVVTYYDASAGLGAIYGADCGQR